MLWITSSNIPFHYGNTFRFSTFCGLILSVIKKFESMIELETHLKEGSKSSSSVIESYP